MVLIRTLSSILTEQSQYKLILKQRKEAQGFLLDRGKILEKSARPEFA